MPAVLLVTEEALNSPPRVRLDLTLPAGSVGVSVNITRVGPDGRTVPVRLADPAVVTGSAWVGYDYEAPYGGLVTYTAAASYYASGRANMAQNPSFEVNTAGWAFDGMELVRDTAQFWSGVASARLTTIGTGYASLNTYQSCKASTTYTASAYVRGTGSARVVLKSLPGAAVFATGSTVTLTGAWQRISVTGATPVGATGLSSRVDQLTGGTVSMWIDGLMLEESASVGAYFDGDTPDAATTYLWAGTPHASTSIATNTTATTESATDTALVAVTDVWLVHPGVPNLSMRLLDVKSPDDMVRAVDRGVFAPYGRELPIIVTDGRRKAPTSQLVFRVRTLAEVAAFNALTSDTATLLLNVPESLGWGLGATYISLGDLTESREVPSDGSDPWRNLSGAYHVTSRPIGGSQSQRTYANLLQEASSYQGLLDLHASYLEVLAPTI